jgi:xanthine dehydrogenase YagS FAD-binding subunit
MQPFSYSAPTEPQQAIAHAAAEPAAQYWAGGTDLMQLLKEGQLSSPAIIDINGLPLAGITATGDGIRIGALTRMAEAAANPLLREGWPMVVEALEASASPQVRNLATIGGNVLQRTRCLYYRDAATPCNKRQPGSGCSALDGLNRSNALLGGSRHCIATHASDLAVTLVALDALVHTQGPTGPRELAFADLHRLPGDTPDRETVLETGELITAIFLPASAAARRSRYFKLRDRASFEWALVSAGVGLDVADGIIRHARVAVGGVGTKPWRLPKVEQALQGKPLERQALRGAAELAGEGAEPRRDNGFKIELMKRLIVRTALAAGGAA